MTDFFNDLEGEIPHLRRYARSLTKERDSADDLVQACLERAISRSSLYQEGTNRRAWLFKIMYNLFISEKRSQARVVRLQDSMDPDRHISVAASQQHSVELTQVGEALDRLPAEQREVLLLVALEGMSYEEVAEIMEIPIGTVRSRLSRAREAMRENFKVEGKSRAG